MLEFGSLGMLAIESQSTVSNITTAPDALWYMVVTLSTVGYGDQYPVTTQGRILGAFVILTGVGSSAHSPAIWRTSSSHPKEEKSATNSRYSQST